jgi:hypothetical protein
VFQKERFDLYRQEWQQKDPKLTVLNSVTPSLNISTYLPSRQLED